MAKLIYTARCKRCRERIKADRVWCAACVKLRISELGVESSNDR